MGQQQERLSRERRHPPLVRPKLTDDSAVPVRHPVILRQQIFKEGNTSHRSGMPGSARALRTIPGPMGILAGPQRVRDQALADNPRHAAGKVSRTTSSS
jgi:hypothetical protein